MEVLGIIPARGGSKRVPGKNIRPLAGKPLIAYTIEVALKSNSINRLIVSTDDMEIAEIAKQHGAEVPFLRPSELAGDTTPDQPVFLHALRWLKEHENYEPDAVLNLRPTTPFKTPDLINEVVQTMVDTQAEIVRTMRLVNGVHHPYWMYRLSDDKHAVPFMDDIKISDFYQRQLLPPVYRINGVVDAMKTNVIYDGNILDNTNMRAVVISEKESIDIDTEFDFKMCEYVIGLQHSNDHII